MMQPGVLKINRPYAPAFHGTDDILASTVDLTAHLISVVPVVNIKVRSFPILKVSGRTRRRFATRPT
jgi:hypothetical protein